MTSMWLVGFNCLILSDRTIGNASWFLLSYFICSFASIKKANGCKCLHLLYWRWWLHLPSFPAIKTTVYPLRPNETYFYTFHSVDFPHHVSVQCFCIKLHLSMLKFSSQHFLTGILPQYFDLCYIFIQCVKIKQSEIYFVQYNIILIWQT